jgi:1-acyl-sn-glycerol-3-phosphate acyltransferase
MSLRACRSRGPLKSLWGIGVTVLSLLYAAALTLVALLFVAIGKPATANAIGRFGARLIIRTCGVKVEVQGIENLCGLRSCLLVANHQSFFDVFAILAFTPLELRFVSKKWLLRIPLFGCVLRNSEHIIVDRSYGFALRRAFELIRAGRSICIFPEGSRFNDGRVHEFEEGAAWLAIALQATCVPLTVSGSGSFFPPGRRIATPGGRMLLKLGIPIEAAGLGSKDRARLTRQLEEAVRSGLIAGL